MIVFTFFGRASNFVSIYVSFQLLSRFSMFYYTCADMACSNGGAPAWTLPCMCILVTFMMLAGRARAVRGKDTVDIFNQMPNGAITVHCQSADDDLGVHVVPQNVDYNWRFHRNFWGTTLYTCTFTSPTGQKKSLQVWGSSVLNHSPCFQKCVWYVRPDGFYVTDWNRIGLPQYPPKFMASWA